MSVAVQAWLFAVALGTSMLGGVLGMASGIFIVPILTMFGSARHSYRHWRESDFGDRLFLWQRGTLLEREADQHSSRHLLETPTTSGALCGVVSGRTHSHSLICFDLRIGPAAFRAANADAAQGVAGAAAERRAGRGALGGAAPRLELSAARTGSRGRLYGAAIAAGHDPDVRRGLDFGTARHRQRRAEDSRHGHGFAPAHQSLLGNLQLHDRCDRGRQRGRLLCARRNRHRASQRRSRWARS